MIFIMIIALLIIFVAGIASINVAVKSDENRLRDEMAKLLEKDEILKRKFEKEKEFIKEELREK